jgi:hypothetical protein
MKRTFEGSVEAIWANPQGLTPQELFAEFGTEGAELFALSSAMIEMMNTFAGANISTVVPPQYTYTINQDGSVTIGDAASSSSSSSEPQGESSSSSSSAPQGSSSSSSAE